MGLNGVEIFTNSSGSHHELRKLHTRVNLIVEATRQAGGIYLYANQQGCDGDRLYYDGCAMIIVNGKVVAQGSQFSLNDVEVVTATVDLEEVRSFRCSPSRGLQAASAPPYQRFEVDMRLSKKAEDVDPVIGPSEEIELRYHLPEEEIALGPACWLWDYLRRCGGGAGFFIPLSGGIDSCATSVIVFSMCRLVVQAIVDGNDQVVKDARRLGGEPEDSLWIPKTPQELCNRIFHTCFMGTTNSSKETRSRAKELANDIGAYHIDLNMDTVVTTLTNLFTFVTNFQPRFTVHGGGKTENLALQNIQARLRMVLAYLFAQLLPTVRKRRGGGGLLVLGSANVDERYELHLLAYMKSNVL
jgi:NAD+ synthase (glutamine-hydrolysing)